VLWNVRCNVAQKQQQTIEQIGGPFDGLVLDPAKDLPPSNHCGWPGNLLVFSLVPGRLTVKYFRDVLRPDKYHIIGYNPSKEVRG
jgi:hypothetical protein